MKIEVGKKYQINWPRSIRHQDIIKITSKEGIRFEYETIKGKFSNGDNSFWIGSYFAKHLIEITENQTNMKPKPFIIYGKTHQLQSIWEDLKEIGYTSHTATSLIPKSAFSICSEYNSVFGLDNYKVIYLEGSLNRELEFHLPQDYQKALDYCKDALDPKYWEEEIKIAGYIAIFDGKYVKFGCKQFSYEELKAIHKLLDVSDYTTISLTIEDQKITLELLERIMDRIVN